MTLYVSNLMTNITEDLLNKEFLVFGEVSSCKIIKDQYTGVSRGFAFVDMPKGEEANNAIRELDKKEINGRSITVAVAREKASNPFNRRNNY